MTFWLITSSPAEGEGRTLEGNCSRWRVRASCVITFALVSMACSVWQISEVVNMKLLHVVKQKFDSGPPDLDKLVQIQPKPKWVLYKTRFFSKKTKCFWTYLQFLRSLKPMVFYCIIFCYIIVQYTSIILYIYIFVYWCVCLSISPLCVFLTCLLNAKVKTLLQKLLARQGPVVLQLVQLWSVLSRLGQQNSSSAKGLPEIPYLETQWFQ